MLARTQPVSSGGCCPSPSSRILATLPSKALRWPLWSSPPPAVTSLVKGSQCWPSPGQPVAWSHPGSQQGTEQPPEHHLRLPRMGHMHHFPGLRCVSSSWLKPLQEPCWQAWVLGCGCPAFLPAHGLRSTQGSAADQLAITGRCFGLSALFPYLPAVEAYGICVSGSWGDLKGRPCGS